MKVILIIILNQLLLITYYRYQNDFILLVKEEQRKNGRHGKVLLLLHNAPSHPSLDNLNKVDVNFCVMYLSPNVTSLIQPMDQHVIVTVKKLYRKNLTRRLSQNNCKVEEFLKIFNLRDCCYSIVAAWTSVSSLTLAKAWKELIKSN